MSGPNSTLSIVVATYRWPEALATVFRALADQTDASFEVVVADDGSGEETAEVVDGWRDRFPIEHVWQPDEGFRRARILNLAARAAQGAYLVFLDGDCLPRRGFARAIRRAALPGWFVASKRLHMSRDLTERVLARQAPVWRWSAAGWLLRAPRELVASPHQVNRPGVLLPLRDPRRPWRVGQPEFSPPYDAYGCVFGVFREDFTRVDGFDMRFHGWGGEDVDLAARLRRAGLTCGWPGPQATVLHLCHPRSAAPGANAALVRESATSSHVEAVEGLSLLERESTSVS